MKTLAELIGLTPEEQNDEIREIVNSEMPRPAGGFESSCDEASWKHSSEQRFMELCDELTAWEEAKKQGVKSFWCSLHTGEQLSFIGQSWESAGGNSVAKFAVYELDPSDADDSNTVNDWFNGYE
jgi:hypothetical protein